MTSMEVVVLLTGLVIAVLSVAFLVHDRRFFYIPDVPNQRSLHSQVVPRTGGMGIFAAIGWSVGLLYAIGLDNAPGLILLGAALPILVVSLMDDRWQLPAWTRLLVHSVAATLLIYLYPVSQLSILPGMDLSAPVLVWMGALGLVIWLTNLYNFMDGMDGFAGGMALFGFGTLAILGCLVGDMQYALFCGTVATAAVGFLFFNFPPAKIFMGDVGSSGLGFLVGGIALWGEFGGVVDLWQSMLIFSPFVVDATVTLLRRILKGERVWQAHRTHFYQRIVRCGFSHRRIVLFEYAIMLGLSLTAIALHFFETEAGWVALMFWAAIYLFCARAVVHFEKNRMEQERI